MKSAFYRLLIAGVVVFGSVRLTNFWSDYPDTFPAPLRWLGLQLIELFEHRTPEEAADLEQLFVLAVSLAVVSFTTWLAIVLARRFR